MTNKPLTNAALLRKVARLEAQLKAAEEFVARINHCDINIIMQNADLRLRMEQAAELLKGGAA